MSQKVVIEFTDTTALASSNIFVELGFQPDKLVIQNMTVSDKLRIDWDRSMLNTAAIAGGISTTAVATDMDGAALTAADATGVQMYAGGEDIIYNDPSTPTYKKAADGTAVTAGTFIDVDGDVLSRELPQKPGVTSDTFGRVYKTKPGIKLSTLAALRGDGELIRITASLEENAPDGI